ncbi:MAG: hypothetical protein KDB03_25720 [Planctomycetales bacterium]|nr:hypothetical protein [Planctomycetales bacterium]
MRLRTLATTLAVLCGLATFLSNTVEATVVIFSVGDSSLALTGNVDVSGVGSFAMSDQAPGSRETTYTGTITVDVDDLFNPTVMSVLSANVIANVNGNWSPNDGGTAPSPLSPGNYGISVPLIGGTGKARGVVFDLAAASTAVAAGGAFNVSGESFTFTAGNLDVFSTALNDGNSVALTGSAANVSALAGQYTSSPTELLLRVPAQFTIPFTIAGTPTVSGTMTLTGVLNGVASVPEPSTFGLTAMWGLLLVRRRRS